MLSKIKDILIIVNKGQLNQYKKILPDGNNLGIKIYNSFFVQKKFYKYQHPMFYFKTLSTHFTDVVKN